MAVQGWQSSAAANHIVMHATSTDSAALPSGKAEQLPLLSSLWHDQQCQAGTPPRGDLSDASDSTSHARAR